MNKEPETPKENPFQDKVKSLLGENANQELIGGIVALLGEQEEAVKKAENENLSTLKAELDKLQGKYGELMTETKQRKEKIKALSKSEEDQKSEVEKAAALQAETLRKLAGLERRTLNSHAKTVAVSHAEAVAKQLDAEGLAVDMDKLKVYLSMHPPQVEGTIDDNGNPLVDAETTEIINQYAQRAISLFTHKKEAPQQAPGLTGGEVPRSMDQSNSKKMVNSYDSTIKNDIDFDKIFDDNTSLLNTLSGGASET